ncbi:SPOR domain-containing protein [Psychroflexus sp. ALD_RP9]|uniref:SPOR domain-containing protein n=1 Tax=Psychroflexus sp. ALD_RP9 TaxID=2777186 RepID=UPI001A90119A|nr:SPOR domain-containing protein [Psychroflexus sp. ALD_RP9]QSS97266.1 SPOR domain-containing protein [Psychroflexus sp. ALD_RP9]
MPILTDEELNDLNEKVSSHQDTIEHQNKVISDLKSKEDNQTQQKKTFLALFILALVLLLVFIGLSYSSPSILGISTQESNVVKAENTQQIDSLKQEIEILQADKQELQNQLNQPNSSVELQEPQEYYAVQIGAFERFNTPLVSKEFLLIKGDENYYLNSYSMGLFKTLEEAKQLRDALKELGFKEAFTAKYVNSKRVDIIE